MQRKSQRVCALAVLLVVAGAVQAAVWEELYAVRSGAEEATVDLNTTRYRVHETYGGKSVFAELRMYYREGRTHTEAVADYEIDCVARTAFRENLLMDVDHPDGSRNRIEQPRRERLVGQEYDDFVGLMDLLCAR